MKVKPLTSSLIGLALLVASVTTHAAIPSLDALDASNAQKGRLSLELIDDVFNDSILENQSIDDAVFSLTETAENPENNTWQRTKAYLSIAHLYWRYGQLPNATEVLTQLAENEEFQDELTVDYFMLAGRIADANGNELQALEHYERAFASTDDAKEREFIQIRLAMIDTDKSNVDALYKLAIERDQVFKNRAAITLAVLGHTDKALELYKPDPNDEKYFRQLIRYAEWAIIGGDFETAQEFAWRAYDNTDIRFDGLYALTLVDESYRLNDELDVLVAELSNRDERDEDLVDLHIDLLTDLERYDEAIELYHSMELDPTDLDARFRLLQIYDVSKRTDEMIAEYERLIAEEPNTVLWYSGLASHYVAVAEPERAGEVWRTLEKNNSDNIDVLVHAGRLMGQMGFEAESLEMVKRHGETHGISTTGQMFLFEVHLNKGRNNEAVAALNELVEYLPEDAGDLRTVADAYERLRKYENALQIFSKVEEHQGEALGYDDRMRLAWLHAVIGNREEALRLWQEIWVQEDTPARRAFAEGQFLLIAAELNKLARIAIDLENKLTEKTASKNDINLLVRIYTEIGDSFSAAEVVEQYAQYADLPEVEKLRQLGTVYLQLQEYDKYDKTLRQLEEIDPENRIEHIQNIVLNMVAFTVEEESDEKLEDIQHWLEQLRLHDEEAVTGEFEASVLSMSGFREQAIESYRYALVRHPQHSDNLLLMGDLMKESGRTDEAVAVFQYVAEHSQDDNEFVVAIDGILNMIGQERFGQRLPPNDQATFRWAHRIILERITGRDDKFYLYTLLGEIAMETLDTEGEFVAVENSISQAGIRRLSVLRELVTMSTRDAGFFSLSQKAGDTERQLRYGRRLIGLRQQLPPEVYISLAKTLLEREDTLGAEKSLNLVRDITGQIDVNQTKADLFQEAGYVKKALSSYSTALALNQDNSTLLLKTAVLREANGQLDVANTLYMKGLLNVLRTQPEKLHTDSSSPSNRSSSLPIGIRVGSSRNLSVNRDYQTFYEPFTQGVIATWPTEESEIDANLAQIDSMFQKELASVIEMRGDDEEKPKLSRFSRLDHLSQFIRRLGASVQQEDFVYARDIQLAEEFIDGSTPAPEESNERDNDPRNKGVVSVGSMTTIILPSGDRLTSTVISSGDFLSMLKNQYKLYGLRVPEEILAMVPDSGQQDDESIASTEATDDDLLTRDFRMAVERQNVDRIARLAAIMTLPEPVDEVFRQMVDNRNYEQALRYAKQLFDEVTVARLTSRIVTRIKASPQELIQLLTGNVYLLQEIEEDHGPFFESIDEIFDLLESPEAKQATSRSYFMYSRIWDYIRSRENNDELLQFFEYQVALPQTNDPMMRSMIYEHINRYTALLDMELNRQQRNRFKTAATDMVSQIDFQDEYVMSSLLRLVLNFDMHENNQDVHLDLVKLISQKTEMGLDVVGIFDDYFSDDKEAAFLKLLESNLDIRWAYTVQSTIMQYFSEQGQAMLIAMVAGDCPTENQIALLMPSRGFIGPLINTEIDEYQLGKSLLECFPDNEEYRRNLIVSSIQGGVNSRITEQLRNAYERDNTVVGIRTAHYLWSKQQEDYISAIAVATDGEPDLTKRDILDDILKRNDESRFKYGNHPDYILTLVRNFGNPGDSLSVRVIGMEDRIPKNIKTAASAIAQLDSTNTTDDAGEALRLFWRNLNTQNLGGSSRVYLPGSPMGIFLNWPLDQNELGNTDFYGYSRSPFVSYASTLAQYLVQKSTEQPQTSERLLDWLVREFSVGRDLELHLMAQVPSQRRFSHKWYELLVQAYAFHPQDLDKRLAELTNAVESETADEHEFSLWMYLSNITEQEISTEMLANFERWAIELSGPTALQTLNTAQMFARAEQWDSALDYYTLYALNLSRSDPNFGTTRVSYGGDPNNPVDLFGLIETVAEHTSTTMARQFVERIAPMVRPFDREISEHSLNAKTVDLLSRVYPAAEVLEVAKRLRPSLDELLQNGKRNVAPEYETVPPLLQVIRVLVASGDLSEAVKYLRPIFVEVVEEETEDPDPSVEDDLVGAGNTVISVAGGSSITVSASQASSVISALSSSGVAMRIGSPGAEIGPEVDVPFVSPNVMALFRDRDTIFDFDNDEWMNLLVESMTDWLENEEMDERGLIEMLSVIAFEYDLRDEPEKVANSWSKISAWLTTYHRSLDRYSIKPFLQLAIDAEFPLDPQVVAYAFELDIFSPSDVVTILTTLRNSNSAEVAFATAELISVDSAGLSVLRVLEKIGQSVNDDNYVREVATKIQTLESAYREMEPSVL
ncbi:MAG: hypothetical protein F4W92_04335 [Gammaproteobacteria bacterium]|nr:hypothetical protein [Gammaproteobacteria bacterium]